MSQVVHPKEWSHSTSSKGTQENNSLGSSDNKQNSKRASIFQKIATGFGKKKNEEGKRMCESVTQIKIDENSTELDDDAEMADSSGKLSNSIETQSKNKTETTDSALKSAVSVYHHKESSCYEIVTFDINNNKELNRLYVPEDQVTDLTSRKRKSRLSFIGSNADPNLSSKFADCITCTLDENKKPCLDMNRPDPNNSKKRKSVVCIKPEGLIPVSVDPPAISRNGKLVPKGKRVSVLPYFGRLSFFRGGNSPPVVPSPNHSCKSASFERISERNSYGSRDSSRKDLKYTEEVPQQQPSMSVTSHLKYDKGVNEMLHEAEQIKANFLAKKAAQGDSGRHKYGRKKKN